MQIIRCNHGMTGAVFQVGQRSGYDSLANRAPSGRFTLFSFADLSLTLQLDVVRPDDGGDQAGKTFLNLGATRRIVHLDTPAFTADQTGIAESLEVLGKSRSGDRLLAHIRADARAAGPRDLGVDGHAHRIGEGVEDSLYCDVLNRRVKKRPHAFSSLPAFDNCSTVRMFGTIGCWRLFLPTPFRQSINSQQSK